MCRHAVDIVALVVAVLIAPALADDLDRAEPYRTTINGAIDVLAASNAAPSQSCVSAIDEMHVTDGQLKDLTGRLDEGGEAPQAAGGQQSEIDVARDVLASDLQSAAAACTPDTERVCANVETASVAKLCTTFEKDIASERSAKR